METTELYVIYVRHLHFSFCASFPLYYEASPFVYSLSFKSQQDKSLPESTFQSREGRLLDHKHTLFTGQTFIDCLLCAKH